MPRIVLVMIKAPILRSFRKGRILSIRQPKPKGGFYKGQAHTFPPTAQNHVFQYLRA